MGSTTKNAIQQTLDAGQSIWIDSISRDMIQTGDLQRLVDIGVTGVTSNPTIFEAAVASGSSYDEAIIRYMDESRNSANIFESLAIEDIRDAADILRPIYDNTEYADGFVSVEVSPLLARDTRGTIDEARRLFARVQRPNVMIKVPGTKEGMPAIRQLISEGVNVNVTLLFAISAYRQAAEAYIDGQADYISSGAGNPDRIASVASFFISRVDTSIDKLLDDLPDRALAEVLKGKTGIANAKLAYREFGKIFEQERFKPLDAKGARVQRPLWGSTSTKNPEFRDVMYIEQLIGPDTVNTVPPSTLSAFLEHGEVSETITQGVTDSQKQLDAIHEYGIDINHITEDLLDAGLDAFSNSYNSLIARIDKRRSWLKNASRARGNYYNLSADSSPANAMEQALTDRLVERIWQKDPKLWPLPSEGSASPEERLGWLTLPYDISDVAIKARRVASAFKAEGFKHLVLLGMGGSSLSPEVTNSIITSGSKDFGFNLLDSTVPAQILNVEKSIDIKKTVFIVSSKSGTTMEPMELYGYFRNRLEQMQVVEPNRQFIAITNTGTALEQLAIEAGFHTVFTAPKDVGGRFSALSAFGIVPAAFIGVDIEDLATSAINMADLCRTPSSLNPGLWLGVITGSLAAIGRAKVTLITSPELDRFGLWAEQLLAETTGKSGTGIVPLWREPVYEPKFYGDDRLFIYLRIAGGDNVKSEQHADGIKNAGLPLITLTMANQNGLWAEFYRWEFAITVASHILKVYPFDEPNVELAKQMAFQALDNPSAIKIKPASDITSALRGLLKERADGDLLAIGAFLPESEKLTDAFSELRAAIGHSTGLATSFGYGPRYQHSTGQLHKGGPDSTMVLVIVGADGPKLPISGERHNFGEIAFAQASADAAALRHSGKRAALAQIAGDYEASIRQLTEWISR